jgi:DNA-binding NarL/FixJ family response regulator
MQQAQFVVVHGDQELATRAGHLFENVRTEFVCAARDLNTWNHPKTRAALLERMGVPRPSGVAVDKLLSPTALGDEQHRTELREVSAGGARIRISSSPLPHETIIIDRRVMILAGAAGPRGREFTVTTSETLVAGVYALFRATWDAATDFTAYLRGDAPHLDDSARTILRTLGAGLTDETAARNLGTSLRTYRRRVAELLVALEADSRFQAGLRAGSLGIV